MRYDCIPQLFLCVSGHFISFCQLQYWHISPGYYGMTGIITSASPLALARVVASATRSRSILPCAGINWTYLAGVVVECVVVDGAVLPVLDLHEAGAFGGAAVLLRLSGRGSTLGQRLQRTQTRLTNAFLTLKRRHAELSWKVAQLSRCGKVDLSATIDHWTTRVTSGNNWLSELL